MKDNLTYIFFTKRKYIYIISAVLIISGIIMSVYGNSQNDIEKEIRLMDLKNPIYSENPNLIKQIDISNQHTKTLTTLIITNKNTQPIYMLHITYKNTHSKLKNLYYTNSVIKQNKSVTIKIKDSNATNIKINAIGIDID